MPQTVSFGPDDVKAITFGGDDVATTPTSDVPASQSPGYLATVEDRAIGVGKRLMRAGQQIGNIPKMVGLPGLADLTDKAAGLAPGTSWQAAEPSNQAQAEGGQYGAALASMLIQAAGPKIVGEGDAQALGRTLETQGQKMQTAVDAATKAGNRSGGTWGYVLRGHPLQALYAGIARLGGKLSAEAVQSVGQLIADDPDAAGKLAVIMDKATDPASGLTLGAPQADFVSSVTDQLNAGKILSGKQRAFITTIFRSIPKP